MNKLKVGIICNRLTSGGGMESHAISILKEIAKLGIEPIIFTKNHKTLPSLNNFEIHSFPTKFIPRVLEDLLFDYWLKKTKEKTGITKCIGFCRTSESEILFCGGTHRGFSNLRKRRVIYDRIASNFEDKAFRKTKFILPASHLIADELRTLYHVQDKQIIIAYPPVPHENFQTLSNSERVAARLDLGLNKNKIVLLFPSASGHERKGLPFILDSIKGINNIELAIAGRPVKSTNPAVVNIGYQTDMSRAYNAADYTILASYYEPFGLVGIESILCGTPVILAKNIGCTEVLSENACLTFSRSSPDSLREILKSLKPGQRTSQADIKYDYSAKHQAQMLLSLLFDSAS